MSLYNIEICCRSFLQLDGVRGQDCQAENIQLILHLPALWITKPLKKNNRICGVLSQAKPRTKRYDLVEHCEYATVRKYHKIATTEQLQQYIP